MPAGVKAHAKEPQYNTYVTYKDFIDKELANFSYEDCVRAIPNAIDGFKPGVFLFI